MEKVAIIGGGLSGLTAAHRLRQLGVQSTVFESSDRLGGRVKTVRNHEFSFDVGASGLFGSYGATAKLARELGLSKNFHRGPVKVAVPRAGKLNLLDTAKPKSIFGTSLLSFKDKIGLLKLLPALISSRRRLDFEDQGKAAAIDKETSGQYCKRTLSPATAEYLIGPLLRALWQRNPAEIPLIDLLWSLKHFVPSMYVFDDGMDLLITALSANLDARMTEDVTSVAVQTHGVLITSRAGDIERTETFDRCIIATPPSAARKIFHGAPDEVDDALGKLNYSCSVNVHLGLRRKLCEGIQLILPPEVAQPNLTTVVFEDEKGAGRSVNGHSAVTLFFRDEWSRARLNSGNNEVISDAIDAAKQVITSFSEDDVIFSHVERWSQATMAKKVGDTCYIAALSQFNRESGTIILAGDYFAPSGVNTAIVSGERAARQIHATLAIKN